MFVAKMKQKSRSSKTTYLHTLYTYVSRAHLNKSENSSRARDDFQFVYAASMRKYFSLAHATRRASTCHQAPLAAAHQKRLFAFALFSVHIFVGFSQEFPVFCTYIKSVTHVKERPQ